MNFGIISKSQKYLCQKREALHAILAWRWPWRRESAEKEGKSAEHRVDRRSFLGGLVGLGALGPSALTVQHAPSGRPGIVRGPYLQCGTSTSVIIRWRTNVATAGHVRYGTVAGQLTSAVGYSDAKTEHEVVLTGLASDTTYYYGIYSGDKELVENEYKHYFVTAPVAGTAKPTRVWVIGDSGMGDNRAAAVRDGYYTYAGDRHTDLWLMLGDNGYPSGTDDAYQNGIFSMYKKLLRSSVLWTTYGNHDSYCEGCSSATQSGPYFAMISPSTQGEAGGVASNSKAYYSFDYANIHFICLDSMDSSRTLDGSMVQWLKADLAATKQNWIVAFWHHAPYSKGVHDSDSLTGENVNMVEMRANLVPLLEAYGVDLVLSGHNHSYERSFLLNGHYDFSPSLSSSMILDAGDGCTEGDGCYHKALSTARDLGTVYVVVGSSSHLIPSQERHPVMARSLNSLGSLVLDIDGNRLDARFIDEGGNVRDQFSIQKKSRSYMFLPDVQSP